MVTYGTFGSGEQPPTALDIATRVETQESILGNLAEQIAEHVNGVVDRQEAMLKPVYRTLVKDIGKRIAEQANLISPVGRRVLGGIKARTDTTAAMLQHVLGDIGAEPIRDIFPGEIITEENGYIIPPTNGEEPIPIPIPVDIPPTECPPCDIPPPPIVPSPIPVPTPIGFCPTVPSVSVPITVVVPPTTPTPVSSCPVPSPIPSPIPSPPSPIPSPIPSPLPSPVDGGPGASRSAIPVLAPISIQGMDWCIGDPCQRANKEIDRLSKAITTGRYTPGQPGYDMGPIEELAFGLATSGQIFWDFAKKWVPGQTVDSISVGMGETVGRMVVGHSTASAVLRDIAPVGLVDKTAAIPLISRIGAGNMVATETGVPLDYLLTGERYLLQYSNPMFIPSQPEVDNAYMRGTINQDQWKCWTRANGNLPECRVPILESESRKPDVLDLISLYRRGIIRSKEKLYEECRKVGVLRADDVDRFLRTTEQQVTISDAIHWNVRDVFDPTKQGLKEIKEEYKLAKDLQQVGRMIGYNPFEITNEKGERVTYDPVELDFIASYQEASPTQTYEGLHRLRPGRTHLFEITIPDKRIDELKIILPGTDMRPTADGRGTIVRPKPITLFEVAKNLKEHDYNPIWRAMLAAISYRVVGRIDLRRLYRIGAFGEPKGTGGFQLLKNGEYLPVGKAEKEVTERYQDEGYSPTDATYLAYYTAFEWGESATNKKRTKRIGYYCKAIKLGVVTREDAIDKLQLITGSRDDAIEIADTCELEHRLQVVTATIQAIRRRFLDGTSDVDDARKRLGIAGVANVRIGELLDLWKVQMQKRPKEVTAQQLCVWYNAGLIQRRAFARRLELIGYNEHDADVIIKHCELGELARSAKIRERQARAAERAKRTLLTAAEREAKERVRAQEKALVRFLALRSEKNLREWWAEGSISPALIRETFLARGNADADITRWLQRNNPNKRAGGSDGESAAP